jgi:hypothetical protein
MIRVVVRTLLLILGGIDSTAGSKVIVSPHSSANHARMAATSQPGRTISIYQTQQQSRTKRVGDDISHL